VVGEAGNGEDAQALIEQLAPDLVLTDIDMPILDGIELLIGVQLIAPLNFDYAIAETGHVIVTSSNGDKEKLQVTETSISSFDLRNTIQIVSGSALVGDSLVQVPAGGWFEVSYGFGTFKHKVKFVESGGVLTRQ